MSQGSAPVLSSPRWPCLRSISAWKSSGAALAIRITVTLLPAALATYAKWLLGSSAILWGWSPTAIFLITVFRSVRMTETLSSFGLTTQTRLLSADRAMGLE